MTKRIGVSLGLILSLLFMLVSASMGAGEMTKRSTKYDISINWYDMGVLEESWVHDHSGNVRLTSVETIDAHGFDYSVHADFLWSKGIIKNLSITENDAGKKTTITGSASEKAIALNVKAQSRKEQTGEFPFADFDTTFAGLVPYLAKKDFPKGKMTLRILDTGAGEIVDAKIEISDTDKLRRNGRSFECIKVRYKSEGVKATLWIAEDSMGPFVVKDVSSSEIGRVVQDLTHYTLSDG